jgi:hypothetical protein
VIGISRRWIRVRVRPIPRKAVVAEPALAVALRTTARKIAVNTTSRRNASHASTPSPNVVIVPATASVLVTMRGVSEAGR